MYLPNIIGRFAPARKRTISQCAEQEFAQDVFTLKPAADESKDHHPIVGNGDE
jgi:hypothetical protein